MTRMLPDTVHPDVRSSAERRVFERIKYAPGSAGWVCLHSLGLGRHVQQRAGEIDFLLLVPHKGVFSLEVKGGQVGFDGNRWTFTNRFGETAKKRVGPFEQARANMFSLEAALKDTEPSDSRMPRLRFGWGVIVPDDVGFRRNIEAHQLGEPPETILGREESLSPFGDYVDRLTAFARRAYQNADRRAFDPTDADVAALVDRLRGRFEVVAPLSAVADATREQLLALTQEQFAVLDACAAEPRCVVRGGAGTGKTVLAVEAARREARDGKRVLLVCFNKPLAAMLSSQTPESGSTGSIAVHPLHGLMQSVLDASPLREDFERCRPSSGASQDAVDAFFWRTYPEFALLASTERGPEFDALILDEAQDFMTSWCLDFLGSLLRGGLKEGRWRCFVDAAAQAAVYGRFERETFDRMCRLGVSVLLSRNCRNTRLIAQETSVITGTPLARADLDGPPVDYQFFHTEGEEINRVITIVRTLVHDNRLPPGRITVISGRRFDDARLGRLRDAGIPVELVTAENAAHVVAGRMPCVTVATASVFKGLENDVIVLAQIDSIDGDWWTSIAYVGMSRARLRLFVLLPESQRARYTAKLGAFLERRAG